VSHQARGRNRLERVIAAVAVVAVVLAAGCGGSEEEDLELQPGTLEIGVLVAPGSDSARADAVASGARIAVDEIENAGGVGGALRLRLAVGPERMLRRRGIRLLILPCAGERLPSPRSLAVAACGRAGRRVVAAAMGAGDQGRALADYADRQGAEAVFVPQAQDERERRVRAALVDAAAERELTLVDDRDEADLAVGLAAPVTVGPIAAEEGTVFATYGVLEPGNEIDELLERHRFLFGDRPESVEPALGYDAVRVLAVALEEAGLTTPAAVAAEVRRGIELRGAFGEIAYPGRTTRPRLEIAITRVRNGRLELADRVEVGSESPG
jgi:ABC-type branched-subunit amino acid transport system substrate-binding protein